jgi:hypothetical protein
LRLRKSRTPRPCLSPIARPGFQPRWRSRGGWIAVEVVPEQFDAGAPRSCGRDVIADDSRFLFVEVGRSGHRRPLIPETLFHADTPRFHDDFDEFLDKMEALLMTRSDMRDRHGMLLLGVRGLVMDAASASHRHRAVGRAGPMVLVLVPHHSP